MPSGVYFKNLGIKGDSKVFSETKVTVYDVEQDDTKNGNREYVFESWSEFVTATQEDNTLLNVRYYVMILKRGKVIELREKLYL